MLILVTCTWRILMCGQPLLICMYHSVPGKHPHTSQCWPAWALTWDRIFIRLYRSCYIDLLKWGIWALTQKWALARDTMVRRVNYILTRVVIVVIHIYSLCTGSKWQYALRWPIHYRQRHGKVSAGPRWWSSDLWYFHCCSYSDIDIRTTTDMPL